MLIGIPKEIKNNENRVALTPAGVQSLVAKGHEVLIETNAGLGSGFADADYANQGAKIVATAAEAWAAELVVKVKEPLAEEYGFLREDLLLFTYLHMAAAPELADAMVNAKTTGVAYETVRSQEGHLPLLVPMSEVAGRMAVQIGAHFLTKQEGGSGVLLGGVPGVPKGKVTIIGGGVVGTHAARIALGLGAQVTILDISAKRLSVLEEVFGSQIQTRSILKRVFVMLMWLSVLFLSQVQKRRNSLQTIWLNKCVQVLLLLTLPLTKVGLLKLRIA